MNVTVVIPFYNGSKWIERSLQSALSQTRPPSEVIIIDDGSEASESEFLQSLANRHPVKVLKQKNAGQSVARNHGISISESEFVCLLDQDDYFLPNHIETLLDIADLKNPRFGFSYGDLWRSNEAGEIISHSCVNVDAQHPLKDVKVMLRHNMNILPSATLISKNSFLEIGGFDPELRGYEDDDLFLRFFTGGFSHTFTPTPVTVWTVNTSSTSFSESMSQSRFIYFNKLMSAFPAGSLQGTRIFGDLLAPRFGFHLADDVIASAFKRDGYFETRLQRLNLFRELMKSSDEVPSSVKRMYLITSAPLVMLSSGTLRLFLLLILKIGKIFGTFRIPLFSKFVRKYSSSKEILGE
jgi:glycosyltransferase involved in cell wall biosynthesis